MPRKPVIEATAPPIPEASSDSAKTRRKKSGNLFEIDGTLWREGFERVAGVDEAGRGPLAGPVCAAAAMFEPRVRLRGLDDSKRLTAQERDDLFDRIRERAVAFGIALASAAEIDDVNILRATHLAAQRALAQLAVAPDALATDCLKLKTTLRMIAEPKGDQRSHAVAAASVLAKVTRDRLMARLADEFPGYGFESHKGYPTPPHYRALAELGPTTIHRATFAGVDFFGQEPRVSRTTQALRLEASTLGADAPASVRLAFASHVAATAERAVGVLPEVEIEELRALAARFGAVADEAKRRSPT